MEFHPEEPTVSDSFMTDQGPISDTGGDSSKYCTWLHEKKPNCKQPMSQKAAFLGFFFFFLCFSLLRPLQIKKRLKGTILSLKQKNNKKVVNTNGLEDCKTCKKVTLPPQRGPLRTELQNGCKLFPQGLHYYTHWVE